MHSEALLRNSVVCWRLEEQTMELHKHSVVVIRSRRYVCCMPFRQGVEVEGTEEERKMEGRR